MRCAPIRSANLGSLGLLLPSGNVDPPVVIASARLGLDRATL
jgi:hypothetical protein